MRSHNYGIFGKTQLNVFFEQLIFRVKFSKWEVQHQRCQTLPNVCARSECSSILPRNGYKHRENLNCEANLKMMHNLKNKTETTKFAGQTNASKQSKVYISNDKQSTSPPPPLCLLQPYHSYSTLLFIHSSVANLYEQQLQSQLKAVREIVEFLESDFLMGSNSCNPAAQRSDRWVQKELR